MASISSRLIKLFLNRNFLWFCIIGTVNTINAAFFSWVAHHYIQNNIAAVFGYIISITIAFFLNCKIIFKDKLSPLRYLRFLISYIPNFIIYFLVTFITINTLRLHQFWATALASIAGGPITFLIIKLYAFGERDKQKN